MQRYPLLKTAAGGLSLLAAAASFAAPQALSVKHVSVPAWNIITDTLFNLTPLTAGKRNTFLMQQICDLARGDATQQEINQRLIQHKLDLQKLAQTGLAGSMVLRSPTPDRQLACAAYIATSLFQPANMESYVQKADAPPSKTQETSGWFGWGASKEDSRSAKQATVFNQEQLVHDAKIQMAVARATAQLYAVVAQNIPQNTPADWATRQKQIADITREYAAEYLKSIDSFYRADSTSAYLLESVTRSGYSLRNASGNWLVKTGEEIALFSRGVPWFSNGKIIGNDYFVAISIIPAPAKVIATRPVVTTPAKKKG